MLDVVLQGEEEGIRPEVQAIAGLGLILMTWYNVYYIRKPQSITKVWGFIKTWRFFIIILAVSFLFTFIDFPSEFGNSNPRNLIIAMYGFSTILFFYYGVVNTHLNTKKVNWIIFFLLFNGFYEIYYAITRPAINRGVEVINTSAGYVFLMIVPLLMYRFKKENLWIFIITIILTMMTGKRGALLIYLGLILYGFVNRKMIINVFKLNWKVFLFFGIIIASYLFLMENAFDSLEHRMLNIEDSERGTIASGRDVIWSTLLSHWYSANNFIHLFFGYGFYATSVIEGHIAHNDFIEFLVDIGLIGLFVYLLVLFQLYKNIKVIKKMDSYVYVLLMFCLIILVGRGMASGTIRTDNINLSISIGYLLGIATLKRINYGK